MLNALCGAADAPCKRNARADAKRAKENMTVATGGKLLKNQKRMV